MVLLVMWSTAWADESKSKVDKTELRAWNEQYKAFFASRSFEPGLTVHLALYDGPGATGKRLPVHRWELRSNKSVVMFDDEAGVIETLGEGSAVIEAHVAVDDHFRSYFFSVNVKQGNLCWTVLPKGTEKAPIVMVPGQVKAFTTKLSVTADGRLLRRRMEVLSENESVVSIIGPDAKPSSSFVGVTGELLTIRSNAIGDVKLIAKSSGREEVIHIKVVMPVLKVSFAQKLEQESQCEVEGRVEFPSHPSFNFNEFFKIKLEVTGGEVLSTTPHSSGLKVTSRVYLPSQGNLSGKLSIVTIDDKPVSGIDPFVHTARIKPTVHSLAIVKVRSTVVRGDRFFVNVVAYDHKLKEVPPADRGPLNASLLPAPPVTWPTRDEGHFTDRPAMPVLLTELTDKGDLMQILSSPFDGPCDLTVSLKNAPYASSTARIRLVEPVDVTARKLTSAQHVRDLIGHQAAREFDVYELTAINNLGQVEDATSIVRGASVNLLGETLLMPVELLRNASIRTKASGGETSGSVKESSPEELQQFLNGIGSSVHVYVPPVYSERFELVREAVAHRDPARAAQRFFDQIADIASFMHAQFKSSHSNPFRGDDDATRRVAAKAVLDVWFNRHDSEVAKRGKLLGTSQFLTRSTSVPPDRPLTVFYLVPKDTWRDLEKNAKWKVNFYPVCRVRINYEVTIRTEQTQAGRNGNGQ